MQLDSPVIIGNPSESPRALGNLTGAVVIDLTAASFFIGTVTGPVTWSIVGDAALRGALVKVINGGAAAHTFPASVKFPGGVAPVFTTSGTDFLSIFTHDGVTFYASIAIKDAK